MTEGLDQEYESSADVLTAKDSHGSTPSIRLMRGQVVVRELFERYAVWMPDDGPRKMKTHRGVVLAMGEPARNPRVFDGEKWVGGVEVEYGFEVGAIVQYHFTHHQEAWTMPWPLDGKPATWLPQINIDAVIE
jgi:hypothetical protein